MKDLISILSDYGNALVTGLALLLSTISLLIQHRRNEREVGRLEVTEVRGPTYTTKKKDPDPYAPENEQEEKEVVSIHVGVAGRNATNGTFYIEDVKLILNWGSSEIELSSEKNSFPYKLSEKMPFSDDYYAILESEIEARDKMIGIIVFYTSNGRRIVPVKMTEEEKNKQYPVR